MGVGADMSVRSESPATTRQRIPEEVHEHVPDGSEADATSRRRTMRILGPLVFVAVIAGMILLGVRSGWWTVLVASLILAVYYVIAASPEWLAAAARVHDDTLKHKQEESESVPGASRVISLGESGHSDRSGLVGR